MRVPVADAREWSVLAAIRALAAAIQRVQTSPTARPV